MKATLEFNLPEDLVEFRISSDAISWALAVQDIDNFLRNKIKYGHEYPSIVTALGDIRESLFDILDSHNINLTQLE